MEIQAGIIVQPHTFWSKKAFYLSGQIIILLFNIQFFYRLPLRGLAGISNLCC